MAQGIAVLVLLVLVIVSYVILRPVSDEPAGRPVWANRSKNSGFRGSIRSAQFPLVTPCTRA